MNQSKGSDSPAQTWRGIPRDQIDWHPAISFESCTACGICYKNCPNSVYDFEADTGRPIVARPLSCVVGCTGCANRCPVAAISFPDKQYLIKLIQQQNK